MWIYTRFITVGVLLLSCSTLVSQGHGRWRLQTRRHSPDKTAGAAFFLPDSSRCRFKTKWLQKLIKSVSPGGIYRAKDTRRSKQVWKEKAGSVGDSSGQSETSLLLKMFTNSDRGVRSGGAAHAKYKPSYEISEVITWNITGAPGELNRDPSRSGQPWWTEGSRTETEGKICCWLSPALLNTAGVPPVSCMTDVLRIRVCHLRTPADFLDGDVGWGVPGGIWRATMRSLSVSNCSTGPPPQLQRFHSSAWKTEIECSVFLYWTWLLCGWKVLL